MRVRHSISCSPDRVAGDVGLVGALHHPPQGVVVVSVQPRPIETLGPLFDQGIEVVGLLKIEVVLAIVRVRRDELTADRLVDLPEHGFHLRQEIVRRVSSEFLDAGLVQAKTVPQLLGGRPETGMDIAGRQPVHRQGVDDADRHRLVRGPGVGLLDT